MSFSSIIKPGEVIIDDSNWRTHAVSDPIIDGTQMSRGLIPRPEPFGRCGWAQELAIQPFDEKTLAEIAEEREAKGQLLSNFALKNNIPCKDQNGTNYCWINAPVHCVEVVRCLQGMPYTSLSPASAGGPIKNFRNYGGWGTEGLRWMAEHGVCPTAQWPDNAINRSYYTDANKKLMLNYRTLEWDDIQRQMLAVATVILVLGRPVAVGYNWWSHEVTIYDPIFKGGRLVGWRIRNSWSMSWGDKGFGILEGRKAEPDDCVSPRSLVNFDGTAINSSSSSLAG
jgi:hypothetical protein